MEPLSTGVGGASAAAGIAMRCVAVAAVVGRRSLQVSNSGTARKVTPAAGSQQTPVHVTGVLGTWGPAWL